MSWGTPSAAAASILPKAHRLLQSYSRPPTLPDGDGNGDGNGNGNGTDDPAETVWWIFSILPKAHRMLQSYSRPRPSQTGTGTGTGMGTGTGPPLADSDSKIQNNSY